MWPFNKNRSADSVNQMLEQTCQELAAGVPANASTAEASRIIEGNAEKIRLALQKEHEAQMATLSEFVERSREATRLELERIEQEAKREREASRERLFKLYPELRSKEEDH